MFSFSWTTFTPMYPPPLILSSALCQCYILMTYLDIKTILLYLLTIQYPCIRGRAYWKQKIIQIEDRSACHVNFFKLTPKGNPESHLEHVERTNIFQKQTLTRRWEPKKIQSLGSVPVFLSYIVFGWYCQGRIRPWFCIHVRITLLFQLKHSVQRKECKAKIKM